MWSVDDSWRGLTRQGPNEVVDRRVLPSLESWAQGRGVRDCDEEEQNESCWKRSRDGHGGDKEEMVMVGGH